MIIGFYWVLLGFIGFYWVFIIDFYWFLLVFIGFYWFLLLEASGLVSGGSRDALGKVRRHVSLKIEVSQFLAGFELQQLLELGIGVDVATIARVLQLVLADVGVNFTSDIGAGKNAANRLAEESSQLIRDGGRLAETRRSAVSGGLAALVSLVGSAQLTGVLLLELSNLSTEGSNGALDGLELGKDSSVRRTDRSLGLNSRGGSLNLYLSRGSNRSRGSSLGSGLGGSLSLNLSGSGGSSRSSSRGNSGIACGLRSLSHRIYVCLYIHY